MKLENRVAIITGSASGIGKAIAELFSYEGADVVIADLPESAGEKVAADIREKGGKARFTAVDVSVEEQMQNLVEQTLKECQQIDILVNNAAVLMPLIDFEDISTGFFDKMMSVNLKGVYLGFKAVVPHMKKRRSGVILSTASAAAIRPRPGLSIYGACKGGVISLSKALALELAPFGIRVNVINPGATNTSQLSDEQRRVFMETIPMWKIAEPLDIAKAALFLASDDASLITGIHLEIDGGRAI